MPALTLPTRATLAETPVARKLRIAYLTTEYPKVSHTFIRREIAELERRGHEVVRLSIRPWSAPLVDPADTLEAEKTTVCLKQPKSSLIAHAAKWLAMKPRRGLRALRLAKALNAKSDRGWIRHAAYVAEAAWLASRLKSLGINHVHVHFGTNAAAVALLMQELAGITFSMTVHGPGEFDAPIGLSLAKKAAAASFTLAISHFGRAQLCRWVAAEHWERIHVIRCTVNPEFLAPATAIAAGEDRFVCVGRLTPQKGQLLLLEAFARLVEDGTPARLVFAGDGELRASLERRAAELNIADRITITGWLSEAGVRQHILNARALVLPSAAEGLPVVIMEALALGRPVISTFTAGIPELVEHERSGWLVPAGDVDSLSDALRQANRITVRQLNALGDHGRRRVSEQHHPEIEGAKLESLFRKYLSI